MISATQALNTIMTAVVNSAVSLSNYLINSVWPIVLVVSIAAGLAAMFQSKAENAMMMKEHNKEMNALYHKHAKLKKWSRKAMRLR